VQPSSARKEDDMAKAKESPVAIGKFDILAGYTYAKALRDGHPKDEAKERGMVAAVMGAQNRLGRRTVHEGDFGSLKEAAEKKKKTTITAGSFDRQVKAKMGTFFNRVFLPAMKAFVRADLSYEDVKRVLEIPSTWGAKISGEQFERRTKGEAGGRMPKSTRPGRK
jgi:hypothetical protein